MARGTSTEAEFEELVAAHSRRLLGLAHALTGNPHDAWDLTQEALARVGERWRRTAYDDPAAYARTVMVRLNVDRLRRLRRELPGLSSRHADAGVEVSPDVDPWLVEALATLRPGQRTALALRFVEDLDVRGIAGRMGRSEGTVESHVPRGLDRLREHATRVTGGLETGR